MNRELRKIGYRDVDIEIGGQPTRQNSWRKKTFSRKKIYWLIPTTNYVIFGKSQIAMIFQDPQTALNPVFNINSDKQK